MESLESGAINDYVPIAPALGAAIGWWAGSFLVGLGICAIVSLILSWIEIRKRRARLRRGAPIPAEMEGIVRDMIAKGRLDP